jgi:hypothetical protein
LVAHFCKDCQSQRIILDMRVVAQERWSEMTLQLAAIFKLAPSRGYVS